jgi:alcohol dehydrogenase
MKAAVINAHGGPGTITVDTAFPDPVPGPNDVIMRVRATSLNYHDIFTRSGMPGIKVPMPCIMGIDFAGEIVETGPDVKDWKTGDRVVVDPIDRVNFGGLLGEMWHGGMAEYCRVPVAHLVRMPEAVSFEAASVLPVAYGTARRMLFTRGQVKAGERVLILGASGGVGTACVLLANMVGAEVIACASSPEKLECLGRIGAKHLINYREQDFVKEVYRLFGKPHRRKYTEGVDVVVNYTGGDTWVPALKTLHRGGRILTCGATAGFAPQEDLRYVWSYELDVRGSNGWMREDIESLLEDVAAGRLAPLIEERRTLDEVNDAFRVMEERRVIGKVVITP